MEYHHKYGSCKFLTKPLHFIKAVAYMFCDNTGLYIGNERVKGQVEYTARNLIFREIQFSPNSVQ